MLNKVYIKKAVVISIFLFIIAINISPILTASINSDLIELRNYQVKSKTNTYVKSWIQTLEFSKPQLYDEGDYVNIFINEATSYTYTTGQPMLPYISLVKTFPLGTSINQVTCTYSNPKKIHLNKQVSTAPELKWENSQNTPNDIIITSNDDIIETPWINYKIGGGLNNQEHVTILSMHVNPVQYHIEESTLDYIEKIKITVFYELPSHDLFKNEAYSLVIIAPPKFKSTLQRLVDHKIKNGITTKLVTLDEIYNGIYFPTTGYDSPEKIKYFIKNAVELWGTDYILLVGDIYQLPMRYSYFDELKVLTDMYYADLYFSDGSFCSWDSNNNHVYGEYWYKNNKDNVDLYSDVYIGRIACKNRIEVFILVDKIIKYKSQNHDSWWNKIILLGGDTFPGSGVYEGEVTNKVIEEELQDFTVIKLWTSKGTFTPEAINREVNKGARFVEYSGHGYQHGMGTSPPNQEKRIEYFTSDLFGLSNRYKLPVVFFDACLTAKLDYTLGQYLGFYNILKIPFPCYGWYWVKKLGGGAIATIGATEVAYSYVDEDGPNAGAGYLALQFFESYSQYDTVSKMFVSAQNQYLNNLWKDHFTIEQFNLLGDPTLMVGGSSE